MNARVGALAAVGAPTLAAGVAAALSNHHMNANAPQTESP